MLVLLNVLTKFWDKNKDAFVGFLINLGIAILIAIIGWQIIKLITKLVNKAILASGRFDPTLAGFFVSILSFLLRFILVIIIFGQIGIDNSSFIALGAAAVFALAFALQGALSNFAAGVFLLTFSPFKIGDWVTIAGVEGVVEKIELFTTMIITLDGKAVICPNSDVTGNNITNNMAENNLRVEMVIGIDYGDSVELAFKTLWELVEEDEYALTEPAPEISLAELGDNSVNFYVRPWCRPQHYWDCMFGLMRKIKIRFDEVGLNFPFPQRDVHMYLEAAKAAAELKASKSLLEDEDEAKTGNEGKEDETEDEQETGAGVYDDADPMRSRMDPPSMSKQASRVGATFDTPEDSFVGSQSPEDEAEGLLHVDRSDSPLTLGDK